MDGKEREGTINSHHTSLILAGLSHEITFTKGTKPNPASNFTPSPLSPATQYGPINALTCSPLPGLVPALIAAEMARADLRQGTVPSFTPSCESVPFAYGITELEKISCQAEEERILREICLYSLIY